MFEYKQVYKLATARGVFEAPKPVDKPGEGLSGAWTFVSMLPHPEGGAQILWTALVSADCKVE
jgi:hypothetical protein